METNEIVHSLKTIVKPYVQNNQAFENFNRDTDFVKDLEINSANLVDIVLDVEDEFDIAIDNDSMDHMLTVNDAVRIIQEKQGK